MVLWIPNKKLAFSLKGVKKSKKIDEVSPFTLDVSFVEQMKAICVRWQNSSSVTFKQSSKLFAVKCVCLMKLDHVLNNCADFYQIIYNLYIFLNYIQGLFLC